MPKFPENSVAIVTGGNSGIGLATARTLLASGVRSIALLDIAETLDDVATKLKGEFSGAEVLSFTLDIAQEALVDDAVAKTVEKFGRVDFLVNSAGVTGHQKTTDVTELSEADRVWGTDLKGLWLAERAVVRQLLKQESRGVVGIGSSLTTRGAIVNIGSVGSNLAIPLVAPYVMSKHALVGLTKTDAVDFAKQGIRVNAVTVGPVKTKITQILWDEGPYKAVGDAYVSRAPMNRWGEPEEVAAAVAFLLSDEASFITGSSLSVDGGYCAM